MRRRNGVFLARKKITLLRSKKHLAMGLAAAEGIRGSTTETPHQQQEMLLLRSLLQDMVAQEVSKRTSSSL